MTLLRSICLVIFAMAGASAYAVRGSFNNIKVKAIAGGFELQADISTNSLADPIDISLGFAVTNKLTKGYSNGAAQSLPPFYERKKSHKKTLNTESRYRDTFVTPLGRTKFRIRKEFKYSDLNKQVKKFFRKLEVGPGDLLYLHAIWPETSPVHYHGLASRNGQFLTPVESSAAESSGGSLASEASKRSPLELDYALQIDQEMLDKFNSGSHGLKLGGEIHSRLESEGKFQVGINELPYLIKRLFTLASDENPHGLTHIAGLGSDWELKFMDKYLVRDQAGNPVITNGYPTVHPMVDTYYDHKEFLAAQADMAIRYRFTEHNGIGNWNIKPGGGVLHTKDDGSQTGIVDRLEYGIDVTDDDPDSIKSFADSTHNANPFRIVRQQIKQILPANYHNVLPSELLQPSVRLTTYRYKFLLKNKVTGLEIEISIDDVWAKALREGGKKAVRFAQVEMDIEHIAAVVNTQAKANSGRSRATGPKQGSFVILKNGQRIHISDNPRGRGTTYNARGLITGTNYELVKIAGTKPQIDGLHAMTTLKPSSSLRKAVQSTLGPAAEAIEGLRNLLIDLAPYNVAPAKLPLASALIYGHARSQGVQGIDFLIDDPQSPMFDFGVDTKASPNVFSCRSFLDNLGKKN